MEGGAAKVSESLGDLTRLSRTLLFSIRGNSTNLCNTANVDRADLGSPHGRSKEGVGPRVMVRDSLGNEGWVSVDSRDKSGDRGFQFFQKIAGEKDKKVYARWRALRGDIVMQYGHSMQSGVRTASCSSSIGCIQT